MERQLQQCLDKLNKWAAKTDFLNLNAPISVIRETYTMILAWNLKGQKSQL